MSQVYILYLGFPELPLFQTAFTYFNVTKSQLVPGFIKGSVAKVALTLKHNINQVVIGWGQVLKLDAKKFSIDPDTPQEKRFNYTWWCRYNVFLFFFPKPFFLSGE